jgi:TatD DNase family protein
MVDSHCHLADAAFVEDCHAVIDRAREAGVEQALCVVDALEPDELTRVRAACDRWPALRVAIGVHPHRAAAFAGAPAAAADQVRRQLAADPQVRALGEIGLDYHYDLSPRDTQREVFACQLALAAELALPVVIHTRNADTDTLDIIRAMGPGAVRGVFHCFSGDVPLARAALDLGFLISFSGMVTFPKATAIHDAARLVPDDRILIETDCPYLAPVPLRGKRNEPAWVAHVAARLAVLRKSEAGTVSAVTTANYRRVFMP